MPDPTPRAIRVFVSSTFRDFTAERDRLARFTFPRLRRTCEERAVVFTDVDLRWGITDEQAAEGEVLPICLAEIDASRPFFIGILGERYGWVPDSIADELVESHPWLLEHRTKSVTELEIVHGVLNDPKMARRAFFYFRDATASRALGPDAMPERADAAAKLADLRVRIRARNLPVREFATPEGLEAAILSDVTAAIDELFPKDEVPDPVERERLTHDAFGYELADGFVERPDLLATLDTHAAGAGPPLLVTGESGSGKSALLAHWSREYAQMHPDTPVVVHFCGASAAASDWVSLCRRIAAELERATGVSAELPDDQAELKGAFKNLLCRAAASKRFVLALDGVDQLEDLDAALELSFLPAELPGACRLVLSAASGTRPATECMRLGWTDLTVGELDGSQRPEVLLSLLSRHSKGLAPVRIARICASPAASSPLFLSVLADELSVIGSHDTLDEALDRYLDVVQADDVYERVLERWERDYDARAKLVRDALRAIWAARRGLTERELLEVLGDGEPLPQGFLAPLLFAAGRQLTSRGGLLTFSHALLRKAVEDRYLPGEEEANRTHVILANLFARERMSARAIEELPWQLQRATEWQRLTALLADLAFLGAAWDRDQHEVLRLWATVEAESPLRMTDAYRDVVWTPTGGDGEFALAQLFYDTGHLEGASSLYAQRIEMHRATGDLRSLQASLGNQALILRARGDLDGARGLLKEQERICREPGDVASLQASLGNQALILNARGDLDGAMVLLKETERICRELGNVASLQISLGNQATILKARGDLDGAMGLHKEEERICRELGDPSGLQASLGNQALILKARGDLDGAMGMHKEEERICRELGDPSGLQASLGNQALILHDRGDLDGAMVLLKEQERICRELGNVASLQISLGNQALILNARSDLDGAMVLLKEQERICRELGDPSGLQASLGNQALLLKARSDLDGAMVLLKEQERICRELGDPSGLQASLGNQALLLKARGDLDGAMVLLKETERIGRELGNVASLADTLYCQSTILLDLERFDEALDASSDEEGLRIRLGQRDDLADCLLIQASVLRRRGDHDAAGERYTKAGEIYRELGATKNLANTVHWHAISRRDAGDTDGALHLWREEEALRREPGQRESVLECVWEQAEVLRRSGRIADALETIERAEQEATSAADLGQLQQFLGLRAKALADSGEFEEAFACLARKTDICREEDNPTGLAWALAIRAYVAARQGAECAAVIDMLREARDLAVERELPNAVARVIPETLEDIEHAGMTEHADAIRAAFPLEPPDA